MPRSTTSFAITVGTRGPWWPAPGEWVSVEDAVPSLGKPAAVMEQPINPSSGSENSPDQPYSHWNSGVEHDGYIYFYRTGGHAARAWNGLIRVGPFDTEFGPTWELLRSRSPDSVLSWCRDTFADGRPAAVHTWDAVCIAHGIPGVPDAIYSQGGSPWCNVGSASRELMYAINLDGTGEHRINVNSAYSSAAPRSSLLFDPTRKEILSLNGDGGTFGYYDPAADRWSSTSNLGFSLNTYMRSVFADGPRLIGLVLGGSGGDPAELYVASADDPSDFRLVANVQSLLGDYGSITYTNTIGPHGAFILGANGGRRLDKVEIPEGYRSPSVGGSSASWNVVNLQMGGALPGQTVNGGVYKTFCSPAPGLIVMPTWTGEDPKRSENHELFCARLP